MNKLTKQVKLTIDEIKIIQAYRLLKKHVGENLENFIISDSKTMHSPNWIIIFKERIEEFQKKNCPKICECGVCDELLNI